MFVLHIKHKMAAKDATCSQACSQYYIKGCMKVAWFFVPYLLLQHGTAVACADQRMGGALSLDKIVPMHC